MGCVMSDFLSGQVPPPPNSHMCGSGRGLFKRKANAGIVAHTCYPVTQMSEAGGSEVLGTPVKSSGILYPESAPEPRPAQVSAPGAASSSYIQGPEAFCL